MVENQFFIRKTADFDLVGSKVLSVLKLLKVLKDPKHPKHPKHPRP